MSNYIMQPKPPVQMACCGMGEHDLQDEIMGGIVVAAVGGVTFLLSKFALNKPTKRAVIHGALASAAFFGYQVYENQKGL